MFNIYMDDVRPGPFDNSESGCTADPHDWYNWITVRSVKHTQWFLEQGLVDKLSLDHDMGSGSTGYDLVKWMVEHEHWPKGKIWVHSANPVGRDQMIGTLNRYHPGHIIASIGQPFGWGG